MRFIEIKLHSFLFPPGAKEAVTAHRCIFHREHVPSSSHPQLRRSSKRQLQGSYFTHIQLIAALKKMLSRGFKPRDKRHLLWLFKRHRSKPAVVAFTGVCLVLSISCLGLLFEHRPKLRHVMSSDIEEHGHYLGRMLPRMCAYAGKSLCSAGTSTKQVLRDWMHRTGRMQPSFTPECDSAMIRQGNVQAHNTGGKSDIAFGTCAPIQIYVDEGLQKWCAFTMPFFSHEPSTRTKEQRGVKLQ